MKKIAFYLIAIAVALVTACDDTRNFEDFTYTVKAEVTGVELDKSTLEVALNETLTLNASITPSRALNQEVKWSSSNSNVATVSENGEVFGRELGTATITVTTVDGGKTATCLVTVSEMGATRVRINKTATQLNVGEEEILTATITPANTTNKQLTWSSSDEGVATVNQDGVVNAIARGVATITVTTASNETHTCVVTVNQPVTGVELSRNTVALVVGESATLMATVLPANANNKDVKWKISNPAVIIEVDEKTGELTVTRTKEGEVIISVVTVDGEFTASCTVLEKDDSYSNELNPFSATLTDNFQWGVGYSGQIRTGAQLFLGAPLIRAGSVFELEMEFTVSRDFEENEILVLLIDPSPPSWWNIKGQTRIQGSYKAGEKISQKFRIITEEETTSTLCNLHFETGGKGTQGVSGSGVEGPVTLSFSKFVWSKVND